MRALYQELSSCLNKCKTVKTNYLLHNQMKQINLKIQYNLKKKKKKKKKSIIMIKVNKKTNLQSILIKIRTLNHKTKNLNSANISFPDKAKPLNLN